MSRRAGCANLPKLLDSLYQAVGSTCELETFVKELHEEMQGTAVALHIEHLGQGRKGSAPYTAALGMEAPEKYQQYFAKRNIWIQRAAHLLWQGSVMTSEMVCSRSELYRSEYYNDFLKSHHIATALSGVVANRASRRVLLTVFGSEGDAEFQFEDIRVFKILIPQVERVLRLNEMLADVKHREQGLLRGLNEVPFAVLLFGSDLKVTFLNRCAEDLVAGETLFRIRQGRFSLRDAKADSILRSVINRTASKRVPVIKPITLFSEVGKAECLLRLEFVGVSSGLIEERSQWLATIRYPGNEPEIPTEENLSWRFGLTVAESRLTRFLVDGYSLSESADILQVSVNTLRVHLRSIFRKTGANRQSSLIKLVLFTQVNRTGG